jgi:hypothetical protein
MFSGGLAGGFFMNLNWQRRLGIAVSLLWLLFWVAGYLMDPYKDLRVSAFGIIFFGVIPVVIGWSFWWVLEAFRKRNRHL